MRTEAIQQPLPVQVLAAVKKHMSDVGAVVAFSLHHESFGPDCFLCGTEPYGLAEKVFQDSVPEPLVVNAGNPIPGVKDHVDVMLPAGRFGQPVRKRDSGLIADPG